MAAQLPEHAHGTEFFQEIPVQSFAVRVGRLVETLRVKFLNFQKTLRE
jgi:hypothetical protein